MAKKEKEALMFVKKTNGGEILFAVTGMPERTTAPKETAHYIMYSGTKCKRHKMKINSVTYAIHQNGDIVTVDHTKMLSYNPNFLQVEGEELTKMHAKCSPAFKKMFPL